jgi:hypothetical protein
MSHKNRPFLLRDLEIPKHVWALAALYGLCTFAHFTHHAEFLVYYPNLPEALTREVVYLLWMAVTVVGMAAVPFSMLGMGVVAALLLALYGLLGLSGLAHYSLGAWEEHSLVANLLIVFQALSGLALAVKAVRETAKQTRRRPHCNYCDTMMEPDGRMPSHR